MSDMRQCEYCGRPIQDEPVTKMLRRKRHTFCSEFCFRLFFFKIPGMSYEDLKKMYAARCISVPTPDFREVLGRED